MSVLDSSGIIHQFALTPLFEKPFYCVLNSAYRYTNYLVNKIKLQIYYETYHYQKHTQYLN